MSSIGSNSPIVAQNLQFEPDSTGGSGDAALEEARRQYEEARRREEEAQRLLDEQRAELERLRSESAPESHIEDAQREVDQAQHGLDVAIRETQAAESAFHTEPKRVNGSAPEATVRDTFSVQAHQVNFLAVPAPQGAGGSIMEMGTADTSLGYVAQPGDTLRRIAESQGIDLDALRRANPQITDPDGVLVEGQGVLLPSAPQFLAERPSQITLEAPESLRQIADRMQVDLHRLYRANPELRTNEDQRIPQGTVLNLPPDSRGSDLIHDTLFRDVQQHTGIDHIVGEENRALMRAQNDPRYMNELDRFLQGGIERGLSLPELRGEVANQAVVLAQAYGYAPTRGGGDGEKIRAKFRQDGDLWALAGFDRLAMEPRVSAAMDRVLYRELESGTPPSDAAQRASEAGREVLTQLGLSDATVNALAPRSLERITEIAVKADTVRSSERQQGQAALANATTRTQIEHPGVIDASVDRAISDARAQGLPQRLVERAAANAILANVQGNIPPTAFLGDMKWSIALGALELLRQTGRI